LIVVGATGPKTDTTFLDPEDQEHDHAKIQTL